jgi:hypothetical protein
MWPIWNLSAAAFPVFFRRPLSLAAWPPLYPSVPMVDQRLGLTTVTTPRHVLTTEPQVGRVIDPLDVAVLHVTFPILNVSRTARSRRPFTRLVQYGAEHLLRWQLADQDATSRCRTAELWLREPIIGAVAALCTAPDRRTALCPPITEFLESDRHRRVGRNHWEFFQLSVARPICSHIRRCRRSPPGSL